MEGLNEAEQTQFKEMQQQEAADQAALAEEKAKTVEIVETETPKEPEKDKTVPLNALQEERERRKAAEERARQADLNQVRLDERLRAINERLAPQQAPKEIPDPEKDALGALKETAEEVKKLKAYRDQIVQQQQMQSAANQVMALAAQKEAEFTKENPDYYDAANFMKQSRLNELLSLGQDPYSAQQVIIQEVIGLGANALQQGKNPAEMIYSMAKSRGYAKTAKVDMSEEAAKLARIAEGQKANTSLGNVNSTPGKPQMDGKALLAMDDEAFGKWLDKLPMKERAKYMGA